MKRVILTMLGVAALLFAGAPAVASAQLPGFPSPGPVTVAAGTKWTPNPGANTWFGLAPNWCTLSAVGTDDLGNKVGITAAHCVANYEPGAKIYDYSAIAPAPFGSPIGELALKNADANKDYAVIKFYDNRVNLDSTTPGGLEVTHVREAVVGEHVTKDGATTGVSDGTVTVVNGFDVRTTVLEAGGGDSGGPLVTDDGAVVALLRGPDQACPFICPVRGIIYRSVPAALAEIPAGQPGHGFVHVNN